MTTQGKSHRFEVHTVQYWLSLVLRTIDEMLFPMKIGWKLNQAGFKVECRARNPEEDWTPDLGDFDAFIQPAGWPKESYIKVRIMRLSEKWTAVEGTINASHVAGLPDAESFKWERSCPCYITARSTGPGGDIINEAARRRRPDLADRI